MAHPRLHDRSHSLSLLEDSLRRAADGRGGLVMVAGEAGIGKTALLSEAVLDAREAGTRVVSGTCFEGPGTPPLWPWKQVLRGLPASATDRADAAVTGNDERFSRFESVLSHLLGAAEREPVVVVLEDLQWADDESLRLLEFVAIHVRFARVLLLGTYRDTEIIEGHPLEPWMRALGAQGSTVSLSGLGLDGVTGMFTQVTGIVPSRELVSRVLEWTGGNPFFVERAVPGWIDGSSPAIAPEVHAAVRRRLDALPDEVVRVLTSAAALGTSFPPGLITEISDVDEHVVDQGLGAGVATRVLYPQGHDRFAFTHGVTGAVLLEPLPRHEVSRQYAAVVRAARRADSAAALLTKEELAHFAHDAVPVLPATEAKDYLLAAAVEARDCSEMDQAAEYYQLALELVPDNEPSTWATVAIDLAETQFLVEESPDGHRTLSEVVERARNDNDHELLARAALTTYEFGSPHNRGPQEAGLVHEVYERFVGSPGCELEPMPPWLDGLDRRIEQISARTAVLAKQSENEHTLRLGLRARHNAIFGLGTAAERLAIIDEMMALGLRTADSALELEALHLRSVALLEQGSPDCQRAHGAFAVMAEHFGSAPLRFDAKAAQTSYALLSGRLSMVEELLGQVRELADECGLTYRVGPLLLLHWELATSRGRFDDAAALLEEHSELELPYLPLLKAATAARRGEADTAFWWHSMIGPQHERYLPWFLPLWLRFQAETAALSGDAELCESARTALDPFRDAWGVTGGLTAVGPMIHWSGVVDSAQGRWDDAIEAFTVSHRSADRMGARAVSLMSRVELATALLGRGRRGDDDSALSLLDAVERETERIGMAHVAERARRERTKLRGRCVTAAKSAQADAGHETSENVFSFDGEVWTLSFAGRTVHMPDTKGFRDLHLLLQEPGSEVSAVRMLDPEGGKVVVAAKQMGGDPVLDEAAKKHYRQRLTDLDTEIDRMTELGRADKAAEYDLERAALLEQLRVAAGLGGRSRRLGDEAERARKAVTARVRDTLGKLDRRHPELAKHLRATVSTGLYCRYQPTMDLPWRLRD